MFCSKPKPHPDTKAIIQAVRDFKVFFSFVKAVGIKGKAAVVVANNASKKLNGVDLLQLTGVDLPDC